MVSATFGEKINTDRIVVDKTAKEALQEEYPEALANNPGFLGEREREREKERGAGGKGGGVLL